MKRYIKSTKSAYTTSDHRYGHIYVDTISSPQQNDSARTVSIRVDLICDTLAHYKSTFLQDYEDWSQADQAEAVSNCEPLLSTFFDNFRKIAQEVQDSLDLISGYRTFVYYYVTFYGIGNRSLTVYLDNTMITPNNRKLPSWFPEKFKVDDQYGWQLFQKKKQKWLIRYIINKLALPTSSKSREWIDRQPTPDPNNEGIVFNGMRSPDDSI